MAWRLALPTELPAEFVKPGRARTGTFFRADLEPRGTVSVDDAALVRRCLRGDAAAVRALVEQFQAEVYGLCLRLLRHRQDAEDVTQEVFLRVFRSLRRWDRSRPLKPWIRAIAVNRCRTLLAQRRRRPEPADYLQDVAPDRPADDALLTRSDDYGVTYHILDTILPITGALREGSCAVERFGRDSAKVGRGRADDVAPVAGGRAPKFKIQTP